MNLHSFLVVSSILCLFNPLRANETTCEASQKLFADLCFSPNPKVYADFADLAKSEPEPEKSVWYVHMGNDVEQLHISELLKGQLLSSKDDFSDMCYKFIVEHSENATEDGIISGYGNLTSVWTCKDSLDFPGAEICDFRSTLTKYHEDALQYISYVDNKAEFTFHISCYPNGQVGWATFSKSSKLTEEESQFAFSYAEKLGFPKDTSTVMFRDNCIPK